MPPKSSTGSVTLSDREHQALVAALKHNKNAIEIDYDGYAAALGLGGAASGRTSWSNLKKKLGITAGERYSCLFARLIRMFWLTVSLRGIDSKGSDGATTKKRKAPAAEAEDDEDDDAGEDDEEEQVPKTPKKKTTKATKEKKGKKAAATAAAEADDDEEVAEAPKKKAKATKGAKKGKKAAVKDEDVDDE